MQALGPVPALPTAHRFRVRHCSASPSSRFSFLAFQQCVPATRVSKTVFGFKRGDSPFLVSKFVVGFNCLLWTNPTMARPSQNSKSQTENVYRRTPGCRCIKEVRRGGGGFGCNCFDRFACKRGWSRDHGIFLFFPLKIMCVVFWPFVRRDRRFPFESVCQFGAWLDCLARLDGDPWAGDDGGPSIGLPS